ncbi:flagellar export protein FliJ [Thiomicrorhabdus sp. Milos-T2]|uniref:flagellar export protein FliJ n=1 Tax=Thiomicrorhabdus sp. Milos-T2 TaxID=90814 RepID=UPI0004947F73|nr:flagellar export protein FliJ [Thiomicrorhabdus sp. Milos-T2]
MANRLDRFNKIIELAEVELDQAAQSFALMQQKLSDALAQVESLENYQSEYAKKPSLSSQISPIQLQTHNAFADKLIQALYSQKQLVKESEKMVDLAKQNWIEKRSRVKALEALTKRIEANETIKLNKAEQRMMDELATQKHIQKKTGFI